MNTEAKWRALLAEFDRTAERLRAAGHPDDADHVATLRHVLKPSHKHEDAYKLLTAAWVIEIGLVVTRLDGDVFDMLTLAGLLVGNVIDFAAQQGLDRAAATSAMISMLRKMSAGASAPEETVH